MHNLLKITKQVIARVKILKPRQSASKAYFWYKLPAQTWAKNIT